MIHRQAVRGIMLTSQRRVLLMQAQDPASDFKVWFAPGGGMEPGENAEECLRREIHEETGLNDFDIGPLIWSRHLTFEWRNRLISQDEVFYLVNCERFEPTTQANPSETELMDFQQFKWWTTPEISTSEDEFAPRLLAEHLESLILNGPQKSRVDVGI